jgi:hypothetical protein
LSWRRRGGGVSVLVVLGVERHHLARPFK